MCYGIRCFEASTDSGHKIQVEIRPKFNSYTPDIVKRKMKAVRFLRLKDIRILQADKDTVMLEKSKYKGKLSTSLELVVYEPWSKDPTDTVVRKVQKFLSKHKTAPPTALQHRLTPHHSKPPHLHGLPEVHKLKVSSEAYSEF
jgi:hypothetical protein